MSLLLSPFPPLAASTGDSKLSIGSTYTIRTIADTIPTIRVTVVVLGIIDCFNHYDALNYISLLLFSLQQYSGKT